MLNAIGLQNIGVEAFLRARLPALVRTGARVVANFWGDSPEEFAECAARLDGAPGAHRARAQRVEPEPARVGRHPRHGSRGAGRDRARGPASGAHAALGEAVAERRRHHRGGAGRRGRRRRRAVRHQHAAGHGRRSGDPAPAPAQRHRRALRPGDQAGGAGDGARARRAVRIPIVGIGGIRTGEDALEFLCCGARAVQVGTATFYDPRAPLRGRAGDGALVRPAAVVPAVTDLVGTLAP